MVFFRVKGDHAFFHIIASINHLWMNHGCFFLVLSLPESWGNLGRWVNPRIGWSGMLSDIVLKSARIHTHQKGATFETSNQDSSLQWARGCSYVCTRARVLFECHVQNLFLTPNLDSRKVLEQCQKTVTELLSLSTCPNNPAPTHWIWVVSGIDLSMVWVIRVCETNWFSIDPELRPGLIQAVCRILTFSFVFWFWDWFVWPSLTFDLLGILTNYCFQPCFMFVCLVHQLRHAKHMMQSQNSNAISNVYWAKGPAGPAWFWLGGNQCGGRGGGAGPETLGPLGPWSWALELLGPSPEPWGTWSRAPGAHAPDPLGPMFFSQNHASPSKLKSNW